MYIPREAMKPYMREHLRDGKGAVEFLHTVPEDQLPPKCRTFSVATIEKGCSIGFHPHVGEAEIYYILSGRALTDDNGHQRWLHPGDLTITQGGCHHSIENLDDEPMRMLVCIIKE